MSDHPPRMTALAQRLRDARLRAGLSRRQAAELTGVSRRTIEQWEQGRHAPSKLALGAYLRLISSE